MKNIMPRSVRYAALLFSCITLSCNTALAAERSNAPEMTNISKTDVETNTLMNINAINLMNPEPGVYTSGQPSKEELQAMADAGIKHIINLRPDSEMDWDEQQFVESQGMTYSVLPIASAADLNTDNAAALDQLLKNSNGEPTLVHCASGNRIGAVIAVREGKLNNVGVEQAVETGKQWGLTKMEPHVREVLSAP